MICDDEHPAILYKYLDADGGIKMIQNQTLQFTRTQRLNDPYDCYHASKIHADYSFGSFDGLETVINKAAQHTGICSLCNQPLNFLMWSYYNLHSGICVGINMKFIYQVIKDEYPAPFRKVRYQNEPLRPDVHKIVSESDVQQGTILSDEGQNHIYDFLSTKASWWQHENEYRLMLTDNNKFDNEPVRLIFDNLIYSVYLGCKCDKDTTETVIRCAKSRKFTVYKLKLMQDMYGLEPEVLYDPSND